MEKFGRNFCEVLSRRLKKKREDLRETGGKCGESFCRKSCKIQSVLFTACEYNRTDSAGSAADCAVPAEGAAGEERESPAILTGSWKESGIYVDGTRKVW